MDLLDRYQTLFSLLLYLFFGVFFRYNIGRAIKSRPFGCFDERRSNFRSCAVRFELFIHIITSTSRGLMLYSKTSKQARDPWDFLESDGSPTRPVFCFGSQTSLRSFTGDARRQAAAEVFRWSCWRRPLLSLVVLK